jgi:ribonuclease HI
LNHECRILFEVPEAQDRDKFGWLPLDIPSLQSQPESWKIYTDGSFDPHHPANAGWGFAVYDVADSEDSTSLFDIYGPVTLDPQDQRYLGAQQSSNHTGELTAIAETLIWLRDEAPGPMNTPAEIAYDSHYAANLTLGVTAPHANHELATRAHALPGSQSAASP